jgi:C4-dicarboxylate-specific signal transduction histidine kinase
VIEVLNAEISIFNIQFVLNYENEATKNSLVKIKRVALYQTLQNLVKNAAEAVKNQVNPVVKLDLAVHQGRLLIKIIDSGPGIPLHLQDKIFHPFYTTKDVGKGTGLGLTIASRLAEINLGKLTLDEHEKQTTFVLNLPLYQ